MKIPLSWLKEFINLSESPEEIAKTLTLAGLEVDGVESIGSTFSGVVVGEVLSVEKHPDADKLCVAKVTNGSDTFQVVCGAPNCRAGIKTAFAMIGAELEGEDKKSFKVKKAKLRGVESSGMLCSFSELKLEGEHEGIVEFEDHVKVGTDVSEMYGDTIFEISLTPNLGHCSSVLGVARELSAAYNRPVNIPKIEIYEDGFSSISELLSVEVKDNEKALRYCCRIVKDVVVKESPLWLQSRLKACGLRPVNNIVDITNYVMLEVGNPLHAFDLDKIENNKLIIRTATRDETFTTLDKKTRVLSENDLVIADSHEILAIAGVMGGANSEIRDQTKNVCVESACFLPTAIRKTSKHLQLQTDASKRFERATDPNIVVYALDLCASLMQKIASGKVMKGLVDIKSQEFPEKTISCRLAKVNELLGTHLGVSELESIFTRLDMKPQVDGKSIFSVKVPTYRNDIQTEIDLVEEAARIYGFENIPKAVPKYQGSCLPHSPMFLFEAQVRNFLNGEGLQEFLTCDLIGPSMISVVNGLNMPEDAVVKVLNPTSIEQSILRTTLLPGLLQAVKYNVDHQNHTINSFEIGRVHFKEGDKYKEQSVVGIVLTGKDSVDSWSRKAENVDFFTLKGIIENLLGELRIDEYCFKENNFHTFHDARQAAIYVGDVKVGTIGEIHPSIQRKLDVPERILFAEISLHDLYPLMKCDVKMAPLMVYPSSARDWTITLNEAITFDELLKGVRKVSSKLLETVSLVDIYRSEKLGNQQKNVTLRFIYRDKEKTVSQEDVDAEHAKITNESIKFI
jgi:phenylalanyl-tRNA synthetase beta chain